MPAGWLAQMGSSQVAETDILFLKPKESDSADAEVAANEPDDGPLLCELQATLQQLRQTLHTSLLVSIAAMGPADTVGGCQRVPARPPARRYRSAFCLFPYFVGSAAALPHFTTMLTCVTGIKQWQQGGAAVADQ